MNPNFQTLVHDISIETIRNPFYPIISKGASIPERKHTPEFTSDAAEAASQFVKVLRTPFFLAPRASMNRGGTLVPARQKRKHMKCFVHTRSHLTISLRAESLLNGKYRSTISVNKYKSTRRPMLIAPI